MPDARRRKRKQRARAGAPSSAGVPRAPTPVRAAPQPMPLPSPTARATGLIIAVITMFLGGLVIYNAVHAQGGATAATQVIGGLLLVAIALIVAVLVAIPERVRAILNRRRR